MKSNVTEKKAVYKKWWFWLIIIIILIGLLTPNPDNDADKKTSAKPQNTKAEDNTKKTRSRLITQKMMSYLLMYRKFIMTQQEIGEFH